MNTIRFIIDQVEKEERDSRYIADAGYVRRIINLFDGHTVKSEEKEVKDFTSDRSGTIWVFLSKL